MGIYNKTSDGLGEFAPSGDPKNLNEDGASKPSDEAQANKALGTLGAGITKAKKYSSLNVDGASIDIPTEGEVSAYNKKQSSKRTSD